MTFRQFLFVSATLIVPHTAWAQMAAPVTAASQPVEEAETDEDGEIIVTGQRPRGSVIGDIPPENVLTSRDIRATGATSIQELLDAVAPQTGSARGRESGPPVLLLNGQRISGFRELRDIPPEAIERMEILPEEVALKYGFAADQRVVNIVLRQRFDAKTVEARGRAATDGGYVFGSGDASKLLIRNGQRSSIALHIEGNSPLYENERDIELQPVPSQPDPVDPRDERTLVGANRSARLSGSFNRTIFGDVSATLSPEVSISRGRSRFGVATGTLKPSVGDPILRAFDNDPLGRDTESESAGVGLSLNGSKGKWRWSATGSGEVTSSMSRSDRGPDFSELQARLDGADPTFDPLGDLGPLSELQQDRGKSQRRSADLATVLNGPLVALPAGMANVTLKLGASALGIDSASRRAGIGTSASLSRTVGEGSASVDLPLAKGSSIGRLTANANAGVSRLSDFGTLTSLGGGLSWSPATSLDLITSFTREENAPSLQALGDPLLTTPGVSFFDATRGETVELTTVTGGNSALDSDRRNVFKLGGNWQPLEKLDFKLRAEYVRQSNARPQVSFPAATPALEAAFPDRFTRDVDGRLVRVDLRPVNADSSRRDTVRFGFDFTKPLKSATPTPAQIARLRQQFARVTGMTLPSATPAQPGQAGAAPSPAGTAGAPPPTGAGEARGPGGGMRFGGPGGGGGFGGRGGGRTGGRLTFSLTDTVTLTDWLKIAPGLPRLDYLDGEALNGNGGRPRHLVEAQAGYYNNGLGARLSADWRSATRVESLAADESLRFSPYASFDLRLFANLGERLDLIGRSPFFLGSSVRFEVNNIFNARPKVRNGGGDVPLAYQPDRMDPIGRTIGISFRKLFLPTRFFRIGGGGGGGVPRGGGGGPGSPSHP